MILKYGILMTMVLGIYINSATLYKNNPIISEVFVILYIYSLVILSSEICLEIWYSLLDLNDIEYTWALFSIEYIKNEYNSHIASIIKLYLPAFYNDKINTDVSIQLVSHQQYSQL